MSLPSDLRYTKTHEWVRVEADGTVTVGITDYAQDALGDMVYVQTPETGRSFQREQECAVVESVKAASDIYAPVSGTVVAKNEALDSAPQLVNEAPYTAWMFKLKPDDPKQFEQLLTAQQYQQVIDSGKH
jgi:glycine cleavage system H protein